MHAEVFLRNDGRWSFHITSGKGVAAIAEKTYKTEKEATKAAETLSLEVKSVHGDSSIQ